METIRFALYGEVNTLSLAVTLGVFVVFMTIAIYAYNPARGIVSRKTGG